MVCICLVLWFLKFFAVQMTKWRNTEFDLNCDQWQTYADEP
jgi:hypothetical protein